MATIKSYSVAKTQKSYDPTSATPNSGVYAMSQGRQGAYDHPTSEGLLEGRVKTLVNGDRAAVNHDVTAAAITTAGSGGPVSDTVIATTTNVTVAGTQAAGLIVKFTTNAAGAVNGAVTIVEGGEGYATSDTVSVDGIAGSKLTLTAA
mgnify:CR=1 FL=1